MRATEAKELTAAAERAARARAAHLRKLEQEEQRAARELAMLRRKYELGLDNVQQALDKIEEEVLRGLSSVSGWILIPHSLIAELQCSLSAIAPMGGCLHKPRPVLPPALNCASSRRGFQWTTCSLLAAALEAQIAAEMAALRSLVSDSLSEASLDEFDSPFVEGIVNDDCAGIGLLEEALRVATGDCDYVASHTRQRIGFLRRAIARVAGVQPHQPVLFFSDLFPFCSNSHPSAHEPEFARSKFGVEDDGAQSVLWNPKLLAWLWTNHKVIKALFNEVERRAKLGEGSCRITVVQMNGSVEVRTRNARSSERARLQCPVRADDLLNKILISNGYEVHVERRPAQSTLMVRW